MIKQLNELKKELLTVADEPMINAYYHLEENVTRTCNQILPFDIWQFTANEYCKKQIGCTLCGLMVDDDHLISSYEDGKDPKQFVEYLINKFEWERL